MKGWQVGAVLLGSALLAAAACGDDEETTNGVGGAAGAGGVDLVAACVRAEACHSSELEGLGMRCTAFARALEIVDDDSTRFALERVPFACLLEAEDCDAVYACEPYATDEEAARCPTVQTTLCTEDVVLRCPDGSDPVEKDDCAAAGLVCNSAESLIPECGREICDPAHYGKSGCEGDNHVTCQYSGVLTIEDCRYSNDLPCYGMECWWTLGGTCVAGEGWSRCEGTGEPCDEAAFLPHCDGTVLVSCRRGKRSDLDCATFAPGYTCGPLTDWPVDRLGCLAGSECMPGAGDHCEGDVAHFCLNGKLAEFDCVAAGYASCEVGEDMYGHVAVYCAP